MALTERKYSSIYRFLSWGTLLEDKPWALAALPLVDILWNRDVTNLHHLAAQLFQELETNSLKKFSLSLNSTVVVRVSKLYDISGIKLKNTTKKRCVLMNVMYFCSGIVIYSLETAKIKSIFRTKPFFASPCWYVFGILLLFNDGGHKITKFVKTLPYIQYCSTTLHDCL